jgi:hypothetical protein
MTAVPFALPFKDLGLRHVTASSFRYLSSFQIFG